jgi:hypothetical protein
MSLGKDFDATKVYAFGSGCSQSALAVGDLPCTLRRGSSPQLYLRRQELNDRSLWY